VIGWVARHIFGLFMGLLWAIAFTLLLIFWTISSDSGTRWLLESAAPRIVAGLNVNGVTGNLISNLQIEDVRFENCQNEIGLTKLVFSWQPSTLTQLIVDINEISADTLAINSVGQCEEEIEKEAEEFAIPEKIDIPVEIQLESLSINRVLFAQGEVTRVVNDIQFIAAAKDGTLEADLKNLNFETLNLNTRVNMKLESPYVLTSDTNWGYQIPGDQYFSGALVLEGDINSFSLKHQLRQPFEIQSTAELLDVLGTLRFDTEHSWVQIDQILPDGRELILNNGSLKVKGSLDSISYDIETGLDTTEARGVLISGAGEITPTMATLAPLSIGYESMRVDANGEVNFEGPIFAEIGLTGEAINPGIVSADYPGDLDFDVDIAFKQSDDFGNLDINIHSLGGVLRGYPVQAKGFVQSDLHNTELKEISVQVGDNIVQADGRIENRIDLKLTLNAPVLDQLVPGVSGGLVGDVDLSGELEYPHAVSGRVNWLYQLPDSARFSGQMDVEGDVETLHIKHDLQAPYQIQSVVDLTDVLETPGIDSRHLWDAVTYTLPDRREIHLRSGKITAKGTIEEIKYALETRVDVEEVQDILVSGAGEVTQSSAMIESLVVDHESMRLDANGEVLFDAPLSAKFNISGTGINPGIIVRDYPGDIDVVAEVDFAQLDASNNLYVEITRLEGVLRDYPIQAAGVVDSKSGKIDLRNIALSVGDNVVRVNGSISESIDLKAEVIAPNLNQILPELSGNFSGLIDVKGAANAPGIKAALESTSLKYKDVMDLAGARIDLDVDDTVSRSVDSQIEIDLLKVAGEVFDFVRIDLQGTAQQHRLTAMLDSTWGALNLDAQGEYLDDVGIWRGIVDRLDIRETVVGDWASKNPVNLSLGADSQKADGLCLSNQQQEICVDYLSGQDQSKSLVSTITELDLGMLEPFLVDVAGISGKLNGSALLEADSNNLWAGNIDFYTDDLTLTPSESNESSDVLEFSEFSGALWVDQQSELDVTFRSNRGFGVADFSIQGLQDIDSARVSEGRVKLNIPDLGFLNPYLGGVKISEGHGDVEMDITGPVFHPELSGSGVIEGVTFTVPEIGITYSDANFSITAKDYSTLDIGASLESGTGKLSASGNIVMNDPEGIRYDFDIRGNDFPVMDTPDIVASISPNLSIRGNTKRMSVGGSLIIPELDIVLNDAPPGVDSISRDEIIVNATEDDLSEEPFPILGALNVSLGEKAHLKGYGLDADLTGKLSISLNEKQAPIGTGIISLVNAKYFALGQTLNVAKGDIIFSGPIGDPTLDLRIERNTKDVEVAMLISGKPDNPETTLTSNPGMSDANKLSYLLTGRGMSDLDGGEGQILTAAALAVGLNRSSSLINEIGATFGFDTVSVGGGDNGLESTSLLLGKHLSPKLYVSYAKDLFSGLGAIQMNYRLTDTVSLEAESGVVQTADIIYSIRK
jgi:translocation and assembly module TamB